MIRRFRFMTVDVFSDRRFCGNPLAVFPDAGDLTDAEMQALAREFNLSETTFVLPPENPAHTARVRIFTPATELPFAGHPNVGTGFVLAGQGRDRGGVMLFEEAAGLVEIRVSRDATGAVADTVIAAPQPLSLAEAPSASMLAACVGLAESDIVLAAHAPVLASMGNPFVIAETTDAALGRARPDGSAFASTQDGHPQLGGRLGLYCYARLGDGGVRARLFAPSLGVGEDPATGSAAAPLAGLLLSLSAEQELRLDIAQGVEMGRPSLLRTHARRDTDGIRATVGGACVAVLEGEARL
jgi:trans-2,3-dihydro-3-hydroxyanthranilate isomerase